MKYKFIIGGGDFLELAYHAWKQEFPDGVFEVIDVPQGDDFEFDFSVLDGINPSEASVFVAYDERFGNFKRMELVHAAQGRGFKLESFISKRAKIADSVMVGENVFLGNNVTVGHGSLIGSNTVIHAGANVSSYVSIGSSCWIEEGVHLAAKAELGRHSTVRTGALIGKAVKVGWGCELGWPRLYRETVPDKTIFDTRYDEPIYVYGK